MTQFELDLLRTVWPYIWTGILGAGAWFLRSQKHAPGQNMRAMNAFNDDVSRIEKAMVEDRAETRHRLDRLIGDADARIGKIESRVVNYAAWHLVVQTIDRPTSGQLGARLEYQRRSTVIARCANPRLAQLLAGNAMWFWGHALAAYPVAVRQPHIFALVPHFIATLPGRWRHFPRRRIYPAAPQAMDAGRLRFAVPWSLPRHRVPNRIRAVVQLPR